MSENIFEFNVKKSGLVSVPYHNCRSPIDSKGKGMSAAVFFVANTKEEFISILTKMGRRPLMGNYRFFAPGVYIVDGEGSDGVNFVAATDSFSYSLDLDVDTLERKISTLKKLKKFVQPTQRSKVHTSADV